MSMLLTKKRQQFHSKIRSQYIQNYMMKIRYQLLQEQTNIYIEQLNRLIQQTSCQINQQQLRRLMKYAYEDDQNNAIIHVGNLLIDNVISMDGLLNSFGLLSLQMKESRYWLWLVKIVVTLINHEDCHNSRDDNNNNNDHLYRKWQQQSIHYVLNKFISVQQVFSIIQCLEILKLLTGNNNKKQYHYHKQHHKLFTQSLLINHPSTIIKLKDHCLHGDKKVSQLSYQTIDQIIEIGDQYTIELIKICSLPQIQRILISGYNKLDHSQKKFPLIVCRIINNIYSSNLNMSRNVIRSCVQACLNPNNTQRVRVEFSYLWLSFCQMCSYGCLVNALEERVLRVFQCLIYNNSCGNITNCVQKTNSNSNSYPNNNNNKFVKIVNNVYCALMRMQQKVKKMNNHNNHNQYLHVAASGSIRLLITQCELILSSRYSQQTYRKGQIKNRLNLSYYGDGNTQKQQQMISSVQNQQGLINQQTVTESVSYQSSMDLQ